MQGVEEAGSSSQRNDLEAQTPERSSCRSRPRPKQERLDHGLLLSWGWYALLLATLCERVAFGHTTRLLFARRSPMLRGSSHRGCHSGIVGFYPGLYAFRRFHIKARLLSHQDNRCLQIRASYAQILRSRPVSAILTNENPPIYAGSKHARLRRVLICQGREKELGGGDQLGTQCCNGWHQARWRVVMVRGVHHSSQHPSSHRPGG
jgi:hypothetical protein